MKETTLRRIKAPASTGRSEGKRPREPESLTTAIHIRRDLWELLREVAFTRARATGGRASVSQVITERVEKNRAGLEREIGSQGAR
jgi:hypothetical protein